MKRCKDCGVGKELSEFYVYRRNERITYYARCKACHKARLKGAYTDERRAENRTNHRNRIREYVSAQKAGPCVDCGISYPPYVMDFDHVRGIKVGNLARMVNTGSWDDVRAEIAKCDLVCSNCHRERTYQRKKNAKV